ncbi:amidase [Kovacikia minuta CCNUW1]|uniref:amidase n=1 Tax=Kovacikia minuta TaxID=2931930 RepID=UPI001CCE2CA3|nr:amidase [Kovacikia minuta]UBF28164.1 amidase [Kovacikia minuta CCNUW1]
MNSIDLAFTPAVEQAHLIRSKEISPLELVELYLERIAKLDSRLGSYVLVAAEQAIADAKAKTEQLATHSDDLPPFFGVPISIKDLNPVAGLPCTYGLSVLKKRVAPQDDGVVTRIKQAGFVILGKTLPSEMGMLPYSEPSGFPPARNPWNLEYTPGGSSGGAAAALAAGLCPISQASDGGGSIRGPAFCCGLVGIKPSRGRISMAPFFGDRLNGIATNGPLGRTVADVAALLDILSGYTTGDPYWLPDPNPSFLAATQVPTQLLKIGLVTAISPIGEADPVCRQAVLDMAALLENLGHAVEPISFPDMSELIDPFITIMQTVLDEAKVPEFVLGKVSRWLRFRARFSTCGNYLRAVAKMQTIARRIVESFNTIDVLLLPTYMSPQIRVGEWANLCPQRTLKEITRWIAPCPPFNATGQPAIALPVGFTPEGLPLGVQLVGRPAAESTLISLAAQVETAQPWSQHRPPEFTQD